MCRASPSRGETAYLVGLALALTIALYGALAGWCCLGEDEDGDQAAIEDLLFPGD